MRPLADPLVIVLCRLAQAALAMGRIGPACALLEQAIRIRRACRGLRPKGRDDHDREDTR